MLRLDLVGYLSFCLFSSVAGYEYISSISREANAMIEKLETNEMPVDGTTGYWKLHRFSAGDPTTNRARCLDGSYAGFWFEGGSGDGVDKFVVHHMGGGWCGSVDECVRRSKPGGSMPLGSSKDYIDHVRCSPDSPLTKPDDGEDLSVFGKPTDSYGSLPCKFDGGLFSYNSKENPLAYNWNKVFVPYCDGASFSGSVDTPVTSNKTNDQIYFRGKDIMDAVYDTLLAKYQMNEANDVIITGSSAGGLTSILHADHIADKIREKNHKNPNIAAIPDAGYFMDYPSIDGEYKLADEFSFKDMYKFQNIAASSSSALAACRDTYDNKNTAFKCLFPQYIMPFIRTPIFFTQSFADSYQFPNVMGMDPHASGSDVVKYVDKFRSTMLHSMSNGPRETGYWLTGCRMHTLEYHSDWYTDKDINGMQMRYAMYGWYQDTFVHKKPVKWRYVDKPWSNGEPSNC